MKKVILSIVVIATMTLSGFAMINNETEVIETVKFNNKDISFGVRGNCGMCKKTIEKAALGVEGVSSAKWDREKKKINVSFDSSKTDELTIHKAIAASGYDTEKVNAPEEAYNSLPGCCLYDKDMVMNQTGN